MDIDRAVIVGTMAIEPSVQDIAPIQGEQIVIHRWDDISLWSSVLRFTAVMQA